jgi:hypothetical protein
MKLIKNTLLIFLSIALLPYFAIAQSNFHHLKRSKYPDLETNFITLTLEEFQFSHPKSQILVSSDIGSSNIYAANRGLDEISIISLTKSSLGEYDLEKLRTVKIPNSDVMLENVFILDIKYSENKVYLSVFRYSDKINSCAYVELIESNKDLAKFKTIFKSRPCLSTPSNLDNISGRIATNSSDIFIAGGNMLMDVGNDAFPTSYSEFCCPESSYMETMKKTNFFGSIVSINKTTYTNKIISRGHRVPQGLFFDSARNLLWESEHGPRGGDEINQINLGKLQDYGYPFVTLGAPYRNGPSNLNTLFNSHKNYASPLIAFVPSVGPSQLTFPPKNEQFDKFWGGDLLLTTLKDRSIYRIRISGNKVLYLERIYIGKRLRSVDTLRNDIIMGTDNGSILIVQPSKIKPEGTFPINDYEWPLCAFKGKDKSCKNHEK